jgi:hypothetical protein
MENSRPIVEDVSEDADCGFRAGDDGVDSMIDVASLAVAIHSGAADTTVEEAQEKGVDMRTLFHIDNWT